MAVIGVPDEKWGETPLALVVPRGEAEGGSALGEELLAWTNARVGKRQKIKQVLIRSDLPRNPNGKVLKRALRAEFS